MRWIALLKNRWLCFRKGHKYLIDEYDANGVIEASQCFKCGKRIKATSFDV
jgi:hypothetical protein